MRVKFTKMHALGNDFVVLNAVSRPLALTTEQARWVADRRCGVGCDQILLVEGPNREDVDFKFRIINADGGEVEQCGNGARCFALFVRDQGLTDKPEIAVAAGNRRLTLQLEDNGEVRVDMGVPEFEPDLIPFLASSRQDVYDLALPDGCVEVSVLSMGNPHAVQIVSDVDNAPVAQQGPLIEAHRRFPDRVNAGFMAIDSRRHVRVRVYERGVGETLACGSGACAAVVVGRLRGLLDEDVQVDMPGGRLTVEWFGNGRPVYMTGPAVSVFEGEIELNF